jgi:diphthamide biosynthesis methyltransferase
LIVPHPRIRCKHQPQEAQTVDRRLSLAVGLRLQYSALQEIEKRGTQMQVDVITLFPEMFAPMHSSMMWKAQDRAILQLQIHNPTAAAAAWSCARM